jgi:hypothetical protein
MLDSLQEQLKPWHHSRQEIWWMKVSAVIAKIADWTYKTKQTKLNLEIFDLSSYSFETEDLSDFLLHCIMINNASLEYPVVINNKWHVIDWRHRICKAILNWQKTIDAIVILNDSVI